MNNKPTQLVKDISFFVQKGDLENLQRAQMVLSAAIIEKYKEDSNSIGAPWIIETKKMYSHYD